MLVSQETSGYNKDDHRDIKNSFISFQEVLSYIKNVVFLLSEGNSPLPVGTLIMMSAVGNELVQQPLALLHPPLPVRLHISFII